MFQKSKPFVVLLITLASVADFHTAYISVNVVGLFVYVVLSMSRVALHMGAELFPAEGTPIRRL